MHIIIKPGRYSQLKQKAYLISAKKEVPVFCTGCTSFFIILCSYHYFALITSLISYFPAGFPARNLAASIAPFPNTALEYAVCLNSITSSGPAKITSCSPTIVPPRTRNFRSTWWNNRRRTRSIILRSGRSN